MSGKNRGREYVDGFVEGLVRVGTQKLVEDSGMSDAQARRLMNDIADQVCFEFERVEIYIPIAYSTRNRRIWEAYHTPSATARACSVERLDQLAAEYGKTRRSLYAVFKVLRDEDARARQTELPGFEPAEGPAKGP